MLILPSRFSNGLTRPQGPFELNRGSLQAQGLGLWLPLSGSPNDIVKGMVPLSVTGTPVQAYDSPVGLCYYFNSAYYTYSHSVALQYGIDADALSVVFWTKVVSSTSWGGWPFNLSQNDDRSHYYVAGSTIYTQDLRQTRISYSYPDPPSPYAWHQVAITAKSGSSGWNIYRNGVAEYTTDGEDLSSIAILNVGSYSLDYPFDGLVADFRAYNRCLSPAEIWHQYDPATRWDLCWQPSGKTLFWPDSLGGAGGEGGAVNYAPMHGLHLGFHTNGCRAR